MNQYYGLTFGADLFSKFLSRIGVAEELAVPLAFSAASSGILFLSWSPAKKRITQLFKTKEILKLRKYFYTYSIQLIRFE